MIDAFSTIVNPFSRIQVKDNQSLDVKGNNTDLDMIRLDTTCDTLELFLNMLSPITRDLVLATLTFEQCRDLLIFTDRYGCQALIPSVRSHLIKTTAKPGLPIALFIFDSDQDDWDLGREAMKKRMIVRELEPFFHNCLSTFGKNVEEKMNAFLDKLRPEWKHTLIPLLFFGVLRTRDTQLSYMDWDICADQFVKPSQAIKRKVSYVIFYLSEF